MQTLTNSNTKSVKNLQNKTQAVDLQKGIGGGSHHLLGRPPTRHLHDQIRRVTKTLASNQETISFISLAAHPTTCFTWTPMRSHLLPLASLQHNTHLSEMNTLFQTDLPPTSITKRETQDMHFFKSTQSCKRVKRCHLTQQIMKWETEFKKYGPCRT